MFGDAGRAPCASRGRPRCARSPARAETSLDRSGVDVSRRGWPVAAATTAAASLTERVSSALASLASSSSACRRAASAAAARPARRFRLLAAVRRRSVAASSGKRAAPHGLEYFGQFARERRVARAQDGGQIGERFGDATRRIRKRPACRESARVRRCAAAAGRGFSAAKIPQKKPVRRQAGDHQSGEHGGSARNRGHLRCPAASASATSL